MKFEQAVVDAVTGHMNGDHPEDNLLIVRAFGAPDAVTSEMIGLDAEGGVWRVSDGSGDREVRVAWPGGEIGARPEIRREVVELYNAACEKLGVAKREEHAPAGTGAHSGHGSEGHGAGSNGHGQGAASAHSGAHSGGHPHAGSEDDGTFSYAIRTATWGDHGASEGAGIMEDIMRMRASREDYVQLAAQHYFMYEALEEASKLLAGDPRFSQLHPAALVREQAIAEDLEFLVGADWRERIEPVPATVRYADRIREVAAEGWLPGLIAHHYTRYLGDLSGGQMIAKRVAKHHGFERAGIAFYDFGELGDLRAFKDGYREALDRLGETLDEAERQRMIDEVRLAYRFNTEVFDDMEQLRGSVAA